jgi:two-component system, OmpR family, sensor histidine kinase ChvG
MAASAHRRRPRAWSRLSAQILLANLAGLFVLLAGVLVLDQMREGLIEARMANLRSQAELIAGVLEEAATSGEPEPMLDVPRASAVMSSLYLADQTARVRLFDSRGGLVTDSAVLQDRVRVGPLDPVDKPHGLRDQVEMTVARWIKIIRKLPPFQRKISKYTRTIQEEVNLALLGEAVAGERLGENGERLVSVSVPVQRVVAVLGVVTVESGDVDAIIAAERRALVPFILVAVLVTLLSSTLLTIFIARPIRKLVRAAEHIRRGGPHRTMPDLSGRNDEIGDLSKAFEAMTAALYDRLGAIESFAADVAHEIKNPLTSIQSVVETLPGITDRERRKKLLKILQNDVQRLNRMITDISAYSRLDADLARSRAEPVDLPKLLTRVVSAYGNTRVKKGAPVVLNIAPDAPEIIYGAEDALARVFQNLIDNARTFSPKGAKVQVRLEVAGETEASDGLPMARIVVEDEGPGIPEQSLENIFTRFYTDRPKGESFGTHSGLGLAIAKQICTAHKGKIWAENRTGTPEQTPPVTGARFIVELPTDMRS